MTNPEKLIELEIKEYLEATGYFCFKINAPGSISRNIKGIADLYAIKNGFEVWIEVKTHIGKQSDSQLKFERNIKEHGGRYIVARGVEDLQVRLKELV